MVFSIFFFFFVFLLFLSFLGFWQVTHPEKIISTTTPSDLGWKHENVKLKTEDGLQLAAWFIPSGENVNQAIILLHGYPADKGNLLYWASFLKDSYHLFFFDFRYFGKSEGKFTSFGYYERKDILSAIEFLKKRGITRIGLMGFSFGGSVGLLTLTETGDIKATVADSPFANLDLMGKSYYGGYPFLQKPLTLLTKFWGRLIYGARAEKIIPEKAMTTVTTPIFILHSKQDEVVSVENAMRLEKALSHNKNAKVWIYDGGIHGEIRAQEYEERVLKFFEKHL